MNRTLTATLVIGLLAASLVSGARVARGQDAAVERVFDEQLRADLDHQRPAAEKLNYDAGGWFTFAIFNYDDGESSTHRMLRRYDLRLWGRLELDDAHRFYVRGRTSYDDWNTGDHPYGRGDEYHDPDVERAWYETDWTKWLMPQAAGTARLTSKVGRQFMTIGTGLVLAMPLDMVRVDLSLRDWQLMAMGGLTVEDTNNIDESDPVFSHQERCFWGVELAYHGLDRHRPFAYYLEQSDHTTPDPRMLTQRFDYSSRYIGLGSEGSLVLPNLRYQAEVVGELGRTFSEGATRDRDEICAMAVDLALEYQVCTQPHHPRFLFEYIWASGDGDRRRHSSATLGGNALGTRDHAFNAFGFRDTGIAFGPRVSNLHIYMVGAAARPLPRVELCKNLEIGTKAFFYQKSVGGGPISDTSATESAEWVGWEWDVFMDWRIASDLSLSVRYGAFWPGEAFRQRDCRQALFAGLTYSF